MTLESCDVLSFVQFLAPTWRKSQHVILARVIQALEERPSLCQTDIARALPSSEYTLHARLKRLARFLSNPRLDEAALFVRWSKLTYRFGSDVGCEVDGQPILPVLLDTTYFEPFAALVASVPCGGRGLPIGLTTYHRQTLEACFPPQTTWPTYETALSTPAPGKRRKVAPASSVTRMWLSQNLIEEHLLDYVWSFLSPALLCVLVADRGFARASLFRSLLNQQRSFVIRFDADTWLTLPDGTANRADLVLPLQPGQRRWLPEARYGQEDQVPVAVLGVWDQGQEAPWYLAANLHNPDTVEILYRWRMRIECSNRDEKTGVILREGGDDHRMTSALHLHRLLLAVCSLQWLAALTGLQAYRDLPTAQDPPSPATLEPHPLEHASPNTSLEPDWLDQGPAYPPPTVPHRGPTVKLPGWLKPFAARGPLSYVRLGMEILRSDGFAHLVRRAVRWLGMFLWQLAPLWRPWQLSYRLKHWWPVPI